MIDYDRVTSNQAVAYNAGRGLFTDGWAGGCPYVRTSQLARFFWRGWYDAQREKQTITSG